MELNQENITARDLGWSIGPALNAAGRMGRSEIALQLLTSSSPEEASGYATELTELNNQRKERTKRNYNRAREFLAINHKEEHNLAFCFTPDMEPGVSGIVATRLVTEFNKPAVFIAPENRFAKGSIRSSGENVLEILRSLDEYFIQYGGHEQAAGFSIEKDRIPEFMEKIQNFSLPENHSHINEITSMFCVFPQEINFKLLKELTLLEPFGKENPAPLVSVRETSIIGFKPLSDGTHASFRIVGSDIKFVIWNRGKELEKAVSTRDKICLWGNLEENFFLGRNSLQFSVSHFE